MAGPSKLEHHVERALVGEALGRWPSAPSDSTSSLSPFSAGTVAGYASAGRAAELDGRGAHAARAAVHEQALAGGAGRPG